MLRTLCIACLLLIAIPVVAPAGQNLDFVVIQPGQPGTTEDAQPVMDALASYLAQQLGDGAVVAGRYFNRSEAADAYLAEHAPVWGIVSLGYYLAHREQRCMTPLASTRPGGEDSDVWRLLVAGQGAATWDALQGTVSGTMLYEPAVAARLMFDGAVETLPFELQGTSRPLRAVRAVLRGKAAGVLLDAPQYRAMQALPAVATLRVLATSAPLPNAAVVVFGEVTPCHERLRDVLLKMGQDPQAVQLLQLLQTEGFGPADARLDHLGKKGT